MSKPWFHHIIAILAGALLPVAFAPFNVPPLAFICMAIVAGLCFKLEARQSFLRAYLFAFAYFAVGVSWVSISMIRFGAMALPLSIMLTALLVAFLSLYPALSVYLIQKYFNRLSLERKILLLFPAFWVIGEWLRGWVFTGFPWLNLGYSQLDTPLAGYAPLIGVYGVSYITVICAGILTLLFLREIKNKHYYALMALVLMILGLMLNAIDWVQTKGEPKQASLLQGNVPQQLKWVESERKPTIDLYTRLTTENWESDIIIWPETALPAFYSQAKSILRDLQNLANENNSGLLIGLPYKKSESPKVYHNSMISLDQDIEFYHKRHLVPFGEFVPFRWLLGDLLDFLNIPMSNFTSGGDDQAVVSVAGLRVGISICYEDAFGEEIIDTLPVAEVLVNVSNDAWFGDSLAPHQHLQMARMRAKETGRAMLRATNNGISAFIDHHGTILTRSPQFQQHVLTHTFQPMQGRTPYVIVGNSLIVLICIGLIMLQFYLFYTRAQTSVSEPI